MQTFGASAPLKELQKKFGFEPERVVAAAKQQLGRQLTSRIRNPSECRTERDARHEESDPGTSAAVNPVAALKQYGQSVWLDYIRRSLITERRAAAPRRRGRPARRDLESGDLREGDRRQRRLRARHRRARRSDRDLDAKAVYERLAIEDIQDAADVLRPVYDATGAPRRLRQPRGVARSGATTPRARSPRRGGSGRRSTRPT